MNTKFFLSGALVLAFAATSCSSDDPVTPKDEKVAAKVTAEIGSVTSRAAGTAWAADDMIGISTTGEGRTVYTNIPYKFDGTGFTANGTVIYFQDTDPVTFNAYYPYSAEGGIIEASTAASNQTAEAQPSIDFLFAEGAVASRTAPTVAFTGASAFCHKMSQITLKLTEGSDISFNGKLTSYTLKGLVMDGSFNTVTGETAIKSEAASAGLSISLTDVAATGKVFTTRPVILFPQAISALELELTIDGVVYRSAISLTKLEGGNNYILPVTVNKTGLTVGTAEISAWNDVTGESAEATM